MSARGDENRKGGTGGTVCAGSSSGFTAVHDNPGRRQPDEAYRKVDKVGPFNYKGLVTRGSEPLDVYYMYIVPTMCLLRKIRWCIWCRNTPNRFTADGSQTYYHRGV